MPNLPFAAATAGVIFEKQEIAPVKIDRSTVGFGSSRRPNMSALPWVSGMNLLSDANR